MRTKPGLFTAEIAEHAEHWRIRRWEINRNKQGNKQGQSPLLYRRLQAHRQSPDPRRLRRRLEPTPLPSTGVTRLPQYYGRFRHLAQPGLSLTGVRWRAPRPAPREASRVASCSLCRHAVAHTPAEPRDPSLAALLSPGPGLHPATAAFPVLKPGRLPHHLFRGLLGVHCTLRPADSRSRQCDPFHQRLRRLRHLHRRSDCYRLERHLPGGPTSH